MLKRVLILAVLTILLATAHQPVEIAQPAARRLERAGLLPWAVAMYRSNEYASIDVSDLLVGASELTGHSDKALEKVAACDRALSGLSNRLKSAEGRMRDSTDVHRQLQRYTSGRFASISKADSLSTNMEALRVRLEQYGRRSVDSAKAVSIAQRQAAAFRPALDSLRERLRAVEAELARLRASPDEGGRSTAFRATDRLTLYREVRGGDLYVGMVDTVLAAERVTAVRGQLGASREFGTFEFGSVVARPCNLGVFVGAKVMNPTVADRRHLNAVSVDFGVRATTGKPEGSDK